MADLAELLVRIDATTETMRRELKRGDQAVADSAARVEAATARTSRAFQQSNAAIANNSRQMGAAIQQVGFQIGDFAVQVASGGGVLRPLIQQGSQLVSAFGPWGAVLGAAGAVAGALATTLLDLSSKTDKAAEAQKAFSDAIRETNDLLEKQEDRAKRTANDQRLKALGDLQTAAAKSAAQIPDLEKQLAAAEKLIKIQREAGIGGSNSASNKQFIQAQNRLAEIQRQLDAARATVQQAEEGADKLFGNIVPPESLEKLDEMERELRLNIDTLGKSTAATLAQKLAADASQKGITDETAAIRGRIVALQAELDQRKLLLDFAADETAQRQKDSEGEVETFVKRIQKQGELAASINEEIRNNQDLTAALGVSTKAYEDQLAVIAARAKFRAAGLNGDEDAAAAERLGKGLAESKRALDGQKAAIQEISDFGERAFDRIGEAITQMSLEGQDAFADLANVGKAIASELTQEFIKLAAINPLKNALFGQNNPTLANTAGLFDKLASGVGSLFGSGEGGTFGGVGNGPAFRADGGSVMASAPYIVGERGPELFIPHTSGTVVSNDNLGRGGNTYYIDAKGQDPAVVQNLTRAIKALDRSIEPRIIATSTDFQRRGVR